MESALTVLLLGCWLAGHSGVWGGSKFLKPTIWVSPSRVVALGGNVTIRCEGRQRSMEFFLRKAGHPNLQVRTVPDGTVAEFPITNVGQEDGGSYTCDYRSIVDQSHSSHPSDPVEIIVGEPSYPKPNISVSQGGAVVVRCWGQHQDVRFVLNKEGRHFPPVDSDGFEAVFSSSNVHRDLGGRYSCSYHSRSEPFAVSYPSNQVELVLRDPNLPRPSISLSPTWVTAPGTDVTIRCQGWRRDMRFFLHKTGDLNPQQHMDPAGTRAEFRIPTVSWQHGGNYSCSYRPRSEPFVSSEPSDTVELVVTEGTDPTQPGATPAPTCPGSAGPGGSESPAPPGLTSPIIARDSPGPSEDAGSIPTMGTGPTQPGAAPAPTRPGSAGPDGSESPAPLGLTSPIIAGVSAAAAGFLLLLLLVAFVCFRITRARKGAALRPSSTSPLGVLEAPAQQDPIYASIDEVKMTHTLEPNPGTDGLTCA
ncbi:immunoglobulin superfamily member 1-like isoform X2 [Trachemys scripta elegans]|uniref:immunoglobulin superfamily member 1-like isoform X2 n=1 Tax=Trachemys scripta elegans TaxID=31138 RepID=UPI001556617A|nr:immunoglobulin superfamily member 1-like isoform X2 [Trachemys scripta elegans]